MSRSLYRWKREVKPTLVLASPIMAGMVSQMLMGLTDTLMVGRVGVVPLAAASLVHSISHLPFVFALGLLSAMAVLGSQAYGARQNQTAGEVLRHGLLVAVACGLGSVGLLVASRPWLHLLGQPPEVIEAAQPFLVLFSCSLLPALVAHACKQYCEALNQPWIANGILLGAVVLNALLNWILVYGHWGAPALGLVGAGWSTLIARTVMAVCLLLHVRWASDLRPFQPSRWLGKLDPGCLKSLLQVGWPVGLQHLLEVSAFAFAALMMGWISADAIAAHQIAITLAATTFMFPLGIGMASCIRVGHAWGAGRHLRMRRIGLTGIGFAGTVMGLFGLLFMLAGVPIASLFITSPAVIALTAQLLLVAAIFQIADGIQVAAISALRGLSDVRVPALIAVLAYWVIAVPAGAAMAFPGKQGAVGIWIGLAVGLGAAAFFLSWRFHLKTIPPLRGEVAKTEA